MGIVALKVDVDTYRGTREGVPRLVDLFTRLGVGATFLFSLGPDHTGRALRRVFRPGFLGKVSRTSVLEHYGVRTLLNGTLLPGPDIGRRCAALLREVRAAGFETGIHCWDHVRWQDFVARRDQTWTVHEMRLAAARYHEVFGAPARTHGAAGWQMNEHAYRAELGLGLAYASDGRGTCPYVPCLRGEPVGVVQLPTTLPTFDEVIGIDGVGESDVDRRLLDATASRPEGDHVFTLHAEIEGSKLLPAFERLLRGWQDRGWRLSSTRALFESLDPARVPRHEIAVGEVAGRSGTLAVQGPACA